MRHSRNCLLLLVILSLALTIPALAQQALQPAGLQARANRLLRPAPSGAAP